MSAPVFSATLFGAEDLRRLAMPMLILSKVKDGLDPSADLSAPVAEGEVQVLVGARSALAGTGLVSAAAQVMMTEGYRRGEATLLAPFEYSAIIWTTPKRAPSAASVVK